MVLTTSCTTKQKDLCDVYINSFAEETNTSFWNNVFTDIRAIPLDLNGALLGTSTLLRMRASGEKLLISDVQTGSAFLLNSDGSLFSRISKIGRGPGEYSVLQSCAYRDNSVFILADDTEVLEYSIKGDYITQATLSQSAHDFIFLKEKRDIAFLIPRYEGEEDIEDRLVITDSSFQPIKSYFPEEYQLYYYGSHLSPVYDEDDAFLCIQPWPRIDKCNRDSIMMSYHFDLHGKDYPEKLLQSDDWEEILGVMEDTDEIYYIEDAFENRNYLLLSIIMMSKAEEKKSGYWLINKKDWSSRIEYFEYGGAEMSFFGMPLMLTPSNEVVFICNLSEREAIVGGDAFKSVTEAVQSYPNDHIMLMCKISD